MRKGLLKLVSLFTGVMLVLGAFGCGGNNTGNGGSGGDDKTDSPWTAAPTVKSTFFSDFGRDENIGDNWYLVNYGWGQNGVAASNAGFTQAASVINKIGATGGIIVLPSYGDYYSDASKRGQGTCLISNRLFGPGKYEVRMKIVPRFGPCSTMWSYYTNSYAITTPTGPVYGHNTADNITYHEIDIECPQIGNGFYGWGGVAYEEYYQDANDLGADGLGKIVNKSQGVGIPLDNPYNDGKWHTFAFDWRTEGYDYDASKGENPGAVIWYMDGKEVGRTAKNTPYNADQIWLGNWFPNNSTDWLGIADFEEAYMYIDWVRVTEYNDVYSTKNKDGTDIKPDLNGCARFVTSQGGNKNWGSKLPINNYVSNGTFAQGDGDTVKGWTLVNANKASGKMIIEDGGSIKQNISAQYDGYAFNLEADIASVTGGGCKAYIEYIKGTYQQRTNSNKKMTEEIIGTSEKIAFTSAGVKNLDFTLPAGANNYRIVIETEGGATAVVNSVKAYLKSDMNLL